MFAITRERHTQYGDGHMDNERMTEDDSVFQLLDVAYCLLGDGENPMKVIRMAMFIAILESHHQGKTPEEVKAMFYVMMMKFQKQYPRHDTHIDFGEE